MNIDGLNLRGGGGVGILQDESIDHEKKYPQQLWSATPAYEVS